LQVWIEVFECDHGVHDRPALHGSQHTNPLPERWLAGAAEALFRSAYDDALREFERTAIFDFEKSGEED
jgi:hypothetical protein